MRTTRVLLATSLLALPSFGTVDACGGKVTVGFDDAGNYHTADGAIIVVGSACVGWDASHSSANTGLVCDPNNDQCEQWLVPPQWPFDYRCVQEINLADSGPVLDDAGQPTSACIDLNRTRFPPSCDPNDNDADNDLCSAYFNQFLTHGRALAACNRTGPPPTGAVCGIGASANSNDPCNGEAIARIEDDGGITCVGPCEP